MLAAGADGGSWTGARAADLSRPARANGGARGRPTEMVCGGRARGRPGGKARSVAPHTPAVRARANGACVPACRRCEWWLSGGTQVSSTHCRANRPCQAGVVHACRALAWVRRGGTRRGRGSAAMANADHGCQATNQALFRHGQTSTTSCQAGPRRKLFWTSPESWQVSRVLDASQFARTSTRGPIAARLTWVQL